MFLKIYQSLCSSLFNWTIIKTVTSKAKISDRNNEYISTDLTLTSVTIRTRYGLFIYPIFAYLRNKQIVKDILSYQLYFAIYSYAPYASIFFNYSLI